MILEADDNEFYNDEEESIAHSINHNSDSDNNNEADWIKTMKNNNVLQQKNKNKLIHNLVKYFGCMIESQPKPYALPDHNGRYHYNDLNYNKLLDTSKYIARTKRLLLENDNYNTRDFIIFIAKKQWAKNILRPLLELCAKNDSLLALRVCSLALILVRRVSDESMKLLKEETDGSAMRKRINQRKALNKDLLRLENINTNDNEERQRLHAKALSNTNTSPGEDKTDTEYDTRTPDAVMRDNTAEDIKKSKEMEREIKELDQEGVIGGMLKPQVINVKQQLCALLSFKDAFCSVLCNEAVTNSFREFWAKEQIASSEDNKTQVAICFSYLRRLLAIEALPQYFTPAEIVISKTLHNKYIVQLRVLLSVIPGICSDLMRRYHDDWLSDVILIIYYTIRGFEPEDLFVVWQSNGIIEDFVGFNNNNSTGQSLSESVVVPAAVMNNSRAGVLAKGALSQKLLKERTNRILTTANSSQQSVNASAIAVAASNSINNNNSLAAPSNHGGRLRGVYRRPLHNNQDISTTTNNNDSNNENNNKQCSLQSARIIRNPFNSNSVAEIPQVAVKRRKKGLAFIMNNGQQTECNISKHGNNKDQEEAVVVAATLVDLLSNEITLKQFVRRVNEDLRRDEMFVGPDLELRYFDILTRILQYHRLKIMQQYDNGGRKSKWVPDVKNVMDALDRMSFSRVLTAIDRYSTGPSQRLDEVVIPMRLYKEMVSYLRVLLLSSESGHHDIAVAALYRLFYSVKSTERLDPLIKLLRTWKPGTYSRQHLTTLVEMIHETLQTLDTAQNIFNNITTNTSNASSKNNKKEIDLEMYQVSAMRFNVDDYFKLVANNTTIRMYTKLLSSYESNKENINNHIYTFILRLCNFRVVEPLTNTDKSNNDKSYGAHLGYLLFNITTLEVFNSIINNPYAYQMPSMKPLIIIIKKLVHNFSMVANTNNLLFVEALFQHPRPQEFCLQLHSIYDAKLWAETEIVPDNNGYSDSSSDASSSSDDDDTNNNNIKSKVKDKSNNGRLKKNTNAVSDESDGEFDVQNVYTEYVAKKAELETTKNNNNKKKDDSSKKKKSKSKSRKKRKALWSDSDDGDNSNNDTRNDSNKRPRRATRNQQWSAEEDNVLKEQYKVYRGSSSIFTSIAYGDALRSLGSTRTPAQIEKRVLELQLHINDEDSDGENATTINNSHPYITTTTSDKEGTQLTSSQYLAESQTQAQDSQYFALDNPVVSADSNTAYYASNFSSTQITLPQATSQSYEPTQLDEPHEIMQESSIKYRSQIDANSEVDSTVPTQIDTQPQLQSSLHSSAQPNDEEDIFEQRSMWLMRAAARSGYAMASINNDDSDYDTANNKTSKKKSSKAKKGLLKRSQNMGSDVDEEELTFDDHNKNNDTTATADNNDNKVSAVDDGKAKRRGMLIDSDEDN